MIWAVEWKRLFSALKIFNSRLYIVHEPEFDISVPDEGPNETLIFICLNISSVKKNMIDI